MWLFSHHILWIACKLKLCGCLPKRNDARFVAACIRKQGQQLDNIPKKGRIDAPTRETPRYPARARLGELYVCQADHDARWTPGLCRGLFGEHADLGGLFR